MKKSKKSSSSSSSSSNKAQSSRSSISTSSSHSSLKKDSNEPITVKQAILQEEEYNSGFSNYLRSSEGIEMMKLFVIANSALMILTMAWPSMKVGFEAIKELIYGEEESIMPEERL